MKLALKIIGWIFLVLLVVTLFLSTIIQSAYKDSFEAQISRANQDCPIPVAGGVGNITSISLEGKFVTYRISYRAPYVNIDAFERYPAATRDLCYLSLVMVQAQGNQADKLMEELIAKGMGIKVVFSDDTGKSFTSEMSPEYLARMRHDVKQNPSQALHDAIQLQLAMENVNLPVQFGEGMTMTNLNLEDSFLVISFEVPEDIYDLDVLQEASDAFAEGVLGSGADDPECAAFLDLCKVSHTGLTYRITGDKSKRQIDIDIPSEMIQQYHRTPASLNIH